MGVTAVSLSIPMYVFGKLFPKFYKEETWTVWKQIVNLLQILFFIAIGNWIYSTLSFLVGDCVGMSFCAFALFTLVIGSFPTVLFILLNQNRLLAIHLKEATEMNLHLQRSVLPVESVETTQDSPFSFVSGRHPGILGIGL